MALRPDQLSNIALAASDFAYFERAEPGSNLSSYPDSKVEEDWDFPASLWTGVDQSNPLLESSLGFDGAHGFQTIAYHNWMVVQRFTEINEDGFGAVLLRSNVKDDDGKYWFAVAFQGTGGWDGKDWYANIDLARQVWEGRRDDIFSALATTFEADGVQVPRFTQKVLFTGQSLGGGLAQYAAYDYAFARQVKGETGARAIGMETNVLLNPDSAFVADDTALITFNAFGAYQGLRRSYNGQIDGRGFERGLFDPEVVVGIRTRHYAIENDVVHRLGDGHLNADIGNVYQFQFRRIEDGIEAEEPNFLGIVESHRIEQGFYYGFDQYGGSFEGIPPKPGRTPGAMQLTSGYGYIQTGSSQNVAALFSRIFSANTGTSTPVAWARVAAGALGVTLFGGRSEVDTLVRLLVQNSAKADKNLEEVDRLVQAISPSRLGSFLLGFLKAGPLGGLASLAVGEFIELFNTNKSKAEFDESINFLGAILPERTEDIPDLDLNITELDVPSNESPEAAISRFIFVAGLAGGEARGALAGLGLGDGFAEVLDAAAGVTWNSTLATELGAKLRKGFRETVDYVGSLSQLTGEKLEKLEMGVAYALTHARQFGGDGNPTFLATAQQEFNEFVREHAVDVASLSVDYSSNDTARDSVLGTAKSLNHLQYRAVADAFTEGLKKIADSAITLITGSGAAEASDAVERALRAVETAGQAVAIKSGRPENPFGSLGFDPAAARLTRTLDEGGVDNFTVFLPYEAGREGQRVKLELSGNSVELITVLLDDEEVELDADGTFILTIPEGQREASFGLLSWADIDGDKALELHATLVDDADVPTHVKRMVGSVTLEGEVETAPTGGRDIRGDWAPKPYVDEETGEVYYKWDDLKNIERIPGLPNTTGFQEYDSFLGGSEGPDNIVTGDVEGVVLAHGGDDRITGSELLNTIISGGAGNDWVEALGYANHANDYYEYQRFGRTIKLGEDYIRGGAGDDRLYGESEATVDALYDPEVEPTGLPGDWTTGGSGADHIYGGAGNDVLMGGIGEDHVVGGAGMDVLLGDDDFQHIPEGNSWAVLHPKFGDLSFHFGRFELGLFPVINYYPNLTLPLDINPSTQDPYVSYYKSGGGADVLIGGAGEDILIGQLGDDTLYGGADDDVLAGWEGEDQIYGGEGDDLIAGDFGRYEQASERQMFAIELAIPGVIGSPFYDGSPVDQVGNDFLDGGAGDDEMFGEGGDDVVLGGDGDDWLHGDAGYLPEDLHGDDLLDGGEGNDVLLGYFGDDKLYGGGGIDALAGGEGNDLLDGGTDDDELAGEEGDDVLQGARGEDLLDGGDGSDVLRGGAGEDGLKGGDGEDKLYGDADADNLEGGAGDDELYGGSGDDLLYGDEDNDLMDGGAGADVLEGGAGDDTYVVGFGYGRDRIVDSEGENRIRFGPGILREDLEVDIDPATLSATVIFGAGGDSVSFNAAHVRIDGLDFSNGSSLTKDDFVDFMPAVVQQGSSAADLIVGTSVLRNDLRGNGGDDELEGGSYADVIAGGEGHDALEGRSGSDRYLFSADETGVDVIADSGLAARAYLEWFYEGIADWEYRGYHGGKWRAAGDGEGGMFVTYFDTYEEAFNAVPFADITYIEPLPDLAPLVVRGDTAALTALSSAGLLDHDVVEFDPGIALADLELTIAVHSTALEEHPEQPWRDGGTLSVRWGDAGFDVEVPSVGYGFVGSQLFADSSPEGDDAGDGSWRGYRLGEGVEEFRFADGSSYSLEDLLQRASVVPRNDYVIARGSGFHLIDPLSHTGIAFAEGILASQVRIERAGVDLILTLTDFSASAQVAGWFAQPPDVPALSVRFAGDPDLAPGKLTRIALTQDGSAFNDFLVALDGFANTLYGHQGNDNLTGGTGTDTLDGGPGNDAIDGGGGNDVYLFGSGYDEFSEDEHDGGGGMDTVRLSVEIQPGDVSVDRDYGSLVLEVNGGDDQLTLFGWFHEAGGSIERIEFSDGTIWDAAILEALLAEADEPTEEADSLNGTTGPDLLEGLDGDDEIYGYAGDDVLAGGAGYDIVEGGKGDDTYLFSLGDGSDDLYEEGGSDRLVFGPGISSGDILLDRDEYSLFITVGEDGDGIGAWDWFYDPRHRLERFEFDDGTVWDAEAVRGRLPVSIATEDDDLLLGTEGNEVLAGLGGDDEIWGYEGNDLLEGGEGDDYFFVRGSSMVIGGAGGDSIESFAPGAVIGFNAGDGHDTVYATHSFTLSLGGGITAADLALSDDGDGLRLWVGEDDSIALARPSETDLQAWPQIRLQLFGSVHTYDFNAAIDAFRDALDDDPFLDLFALGGVLAGHQTGFSNSAALGGVLAWHYATSGSTASLGEAEIEEALGNPEFGLAPQPMAPESGNRPPALATPLADQHADEDAAWKFQLPADIFADPDAGDALTYTVGALPAWLSFHSDTLTFSGTPLQVDVGTFQVQITATDAAGLSASDQFEVAVANVNDAPRVSAGVPSLGATEDVAYEYAVPAGAFTDEDPGDSLVYSVALADGSSLPVWLHFDAVSNTFSGTPREGDDGSFTVRLTATDMAGAGASAHFAINVLAVNDAPLLANALADRTVSEDAAFELTVPADTFEDTDAGDTLTYAPGELPTWLSFNAETRTFSGTPRQVDIGTFEVRVVATDRGGLSVANAFKVAVENVNDAPVLGNEIPDQSATEDAPFEYTVPTDTVVDEDLSEAIAWFASRPDDSALPGWLVFNSDSQTFSGTPANDDVGVLAVKVTAKDAAGLAVADTFTLAIRNVNDAPTVANPLGERSFEAGSQFSFAVPAGTFADADAGDSLTFGAALYGGGALPSWLQFNAGTAAFTGNPGKKENGISRVVLTATDAAGASVASEFGLVIRAKAGSAVSGGKGDDAIYGGTGSEVLVAKGGDDALFGGSGSDLLMGGSGQDLVQGGEGSDVLHGGSGHNMLDGGAGNDLIFGGRGSSLIAGGTGNDIIRTGSGRDVLLFNRGDGTDTVIADRAGDNTLSFGGGIRYSDLTLSRSGKDLVVNSGGNDRVVLRDWYGGKRSVSNLQFVLNGDYDADANDPLRDRQVQNFDFLGLVGAFDQARKASPGLTSWHVTNALLQFHLSGADDLALGGDLAYWYAKNRGFGGISVAAAQQVIGASDFGSDAQSLRPFNGLQEGFAKLT